MNRNKRRGSKVRLDQGPGPGSAAVSQLPEPDGWEAVGSTAGRDLQPEKRLHKGEKRARVQLRVIRAIW